MSYGLLIKMVVLVLTAGTLGFMIGQRTAHKLAGEIVFAKKADGSDLCVFKLQEDELWIAKQKSVVFKVLHEGAGDACVPYNVSNNEEL